MQNLASLSKEQIKIGDVFMINSKYFENFVKYPFYQYDVYDYEEINENGEDILFVVKYIGDGKIQEMVTGEVFILDANGLTHENIPADYEKMPYCGDISCCVIPSKIEGCPSETRVEQYVNICYVYKSFAGKSPIIYSGGRLYEINDDAKKEYLKYTDEQRKKIISQMMEIAIKSRDKVLSGIDDIINHYAPTLSMETIEMAYLDNKLFDFKNKEKSR